MKAEWKALYKDGTFFQQHNADGSENLFKDIQQDRLVGFVLNFGDKVLSLNLPTGSFYLNGFRYNTDISNSKEEKRLIYFIRKTRTMDSGMRAIPEMCSDVYFLGFQTTIDGKNHKRMVSVKNNVLRFEE